MTVKFADLRPQGKLRRELDAAYERVMSSGRYVGGGEVEAFEREWAGYNGAAHCVACGNGFDALRLALCALGVGPGNLVLVPAWTAAPTWAAVAAAGALPVPFGDGKFRVVVHLYGVPAPVEEGAVVVQDAAQAHGLKLRGTCAWSFYPTKNLGACGDAGAVTTDDGALAERLRGLRRYGERGALNSCLDPLQAAFLRAKLPYLDGWNERRCEIAGVYLEGLRDVPGLALPDVADACRPVWHQFVVRSDDRDGLRAHLAAHGVETMIHYPIPPHRALSYKYPLPEADRLAATVLSLPIGPHLADGEVERVMEVVRRYADTSR